MTTVAVLGTGTMGAGMARSLLRAGLTVRAWNRSPEKARPLADDGATVVGSAAEAVEGAEAVLVMLFDADAVWEVLEDVAGPMHPDAVVLQSSTIGPDAMRALGTWCSEKHISVLDTPVLGTKKPAEDGKLVVLASGPPELRDRVADVLDAIGGRTVWAGDQIGRASTLKLACNSWVASLTAAAAQALALARDAGVDPHLVVEAISGGPTDAPYLGLKSELMLSGEYPVAFALDGVRKDLDLMADLAGEHGTGTDLLDGLREVFGRASEAGHGGEDMAAVYTAF